MPETLRQPLVSVVIPTYNKPALLLKALDSVFAQALTDYEVIVVNDGSTDDTVLRLQPLADRLRLITQSNQGIGAARNRGIAEARGKYVALLDHDDWWLPEKLSTQVAFLERAPDCIAAVVPYATSTAPDRPVVDPRDVTDASNHIARPLRCLADGKLFINTSALMFVREKARDLFYGAVRGAIEDVQFHIGLFSRGPIGIAGQNVFAVRRIHDANFSDRAEYFCLGQRSLRQLHRSGMFSDLRGPDRNDLRAYLGHLGRVSAVRQLCPGRRSYGLQLYLTEFLHQLRLGRMRFLLYYPLLLLTPLPIVRWLYRRRN